MKASNTYQYFWAVAIMLAFLAFTEFISDDNSIFDVNIHDTYYVMAHSHLYTGLALLYFTMGLIYKVSGRMLNQKLTAVHTIITIGSFVAYYILWSVTIAMSNPEDILDNSTEIFSTGVVLIFILAIAAQPVLLANIIIGLVKKKTITT